MTPATEQPDLAALRAVVPAPVAVWAALLLGAPVGFLVVTAPGLWGEDGVPPDHAVWAVAAAGLTATATLAALLGWRSWRAVVALRPAADPWRPSQLAWDLGAVGLILAIVVGSAIVAFDRGHVLVILTLLGAAPVGAATSESLRLARAVVGTLAAGQAADVLVELRLLLRRLLVTAGALVALATVGLGAALARAAGNDDEAAQHAATQVLLFGAAGSAIVAAMYVPAATGVRTRMRAVAQTLFPFGATDDGGTVLQRLQDRRALERLLAGDQTVHDELVTSLVVLGPLLASVIQTYVVS